jgi:hypothetical protein
MSLRGVPFETSFLNKTIPLVTIVMFTDIVEFSASPLVYAVGHNQSSWFTCWSNLSTRMDIIPEDGDGSLAVAAAAGSMKSPRTNSTDRIAMCKKYIRVLSCLSSYIHSGTEKLELLLTILGGDGGGDNAAKTPPPKNGRGCERTRGISDFSWSTPDLCNCVLES